MNRLNKLFKEQPKNLLSVYFCAGYPTLESTVPTLEALQAEGVNFVEIGIPFSDPMADGLVIQQAANAALANGMTLRKLFAQLTNIRQTITMPLVLMGYLNPIMQFGFESFCQECERCGVDGVIIPDLPYHEYISEYRAIAQRYGVHIIMLITPETSEERVRKIDADTDGFIYLVSSAATTGAQSHFDNSKEDYFARIAAMNLKNPCMIGFGISNQQTYGAACQHAAGAIVGSKFITLQNECNGDSKKAIKCLKEALGIG
ncbi:MAG: tryptophan synthase subunit alpha [Phocaeicola sp.]